MPTKPRQPRRKPAEKATQVVSTSESSDTASPSDVETPADLRELKPRTVDGRPACYLVDECGLPEYQDNVGLCGRHWALRPDVRKVARRG